MTDSVDGSRGYVVSAGEGEAIDWPGVSIRVKATSEQTNGVFTLIEDTSGSFTVPWHVHEDDEAYYVLDGQLRVRCGEETFEAEAGDFVFLPRGVPHEQMVLSESARKLMLLCPAGIEGFFREMAEAFATDSLTPERRQEIAGRHRMEFVDDPRRGRDRR
jgi:quercetin dioxygenase-like cupin family protein